MLRLSDQQTCVGQLVFAIHPQVPLPGDNEQFSLTSGSSDEMNESRKKEAKSKQMCDTHIAIIHRRVDE